MVVPFTREDKNKKDQPISWRVLNKEALILPVNNTDIVGFMIIIIVDEYLVTIDYFLDCNKWLAYIKASRLDLYIFCLICCKYKQFKR